MEKIFKTKRRAVFLVAIIIGLIFGYRFFILRKSKRPETTSVLRGTVIKELILSGTIKAEKHEDLSFLSSGELDYVGVFEGQQVKKGDVLARLDTTNVYQTFLQAEADLRRYQASLDKVYDEIKGHENDESYSQRETRTVAETNKDKAYRNFLIAQKNLSNMSLRAPFDGIVSRITHLFPDVNTTLTETQIEIVDPKSIFFSVAADQTEVTELKIGQKVKILLDSFPEEGFEGEVYYISFTPKKGELGTVYEIKVKINFSNDIQKIRIGMSGDAKFLLSEKTDILYVPPKFINSDPGGSYLNIGKPNNKVYVEIGIEGEDKVEVNGDVKEGDMVYD